MLEKIYGFLKQFGIGYTLRKIARKLYVGYVQGPIRVNRRIRGKIRRQQENTLFVHPVKFSVLVPLYNTPEEYLREMMNSVLSQTYADWQLCLADGSDEDHAYVERVCHEYASKDPRICYKKLEQNLGISENTNCCIRMAEGDYIALFDHDDLLHPSALFEVMQCIELQGADFVYTDEATFEGRESHLLSIHTKPDYSVENLRANNYICHFTVFQKRLLEKTGYFRSEFDGSQDHDMILRLCEQASKICHIPKVLYFWRAHAGSVALSIDTKSYAVDAGVRAVREHLNRCDLVADVTVAQGAMSVYQVQYDLRDLSCSDITFFHENECFSGDMWDKVQKSSEYILLLKSGMVVPEKKDLENLLMHMVKPNVAAVTAKVIGKQGKVLSGGVQIQIKANRIQIQHLFRGNPALDPGYMHRLTYPSGIPVICNGCMLVRKSFVVQALKKQWDLFDLKNWVRISLQMKQEGYELVSEPRVMVKSAKRMKRTISLQADIRNGIIKGIM